MSELKHMHAKIECLHFDTEDVRLVITERYGKQEIRMHGEDARFIVEAIAAAKRRTQPEATKPAQDLSAAILAIEYGADYADPCKQWAFDAGFKAALKAAAALASPADAMVAGDRVDVITDTQRIDHIEAWSANNKARGMHWNTFCFDVDSSVREQLNAAIQAQKDGHG